MKQADQKEGLINLLPDIAALQIARIEAEPDEELGLGNVDVPGLDLETVLKMLPPSDEEHYVGGEYFIG
jgi:hypothetical protein